MPKYLVKDDKKKTVHEGIFSHPRDAVAKIMLDNEKVIWGSYDEDSGTFHLGKYKEIQRKFTVERVY